MCKEEIVREIEMVMEKEEERDEARKGDNT